MASTETCGVCHSQPSKYKCPTCELRYCSVTCSKTHKASENSCTPSAAPFVKPILPRRRQLHLFELLREDKRLAALLAKYPGLRGELKLLHGMTVQPVEGEEREQNSYGRSGGYKRPFKQENADKEAISRMEKWMRYDDKEGLREFVALVGIVADEAEAEAAAVA